MKKLIYLLTAVLALSFTSCKENQEKRLINELTSGEWVCNRIVSYWLENGKYQSETSFATIHLRLYEDKTFTMTTGDDYVSGSWILNNTQLLLSPSNSGETRNCTIQDHSSTHLLLRWNYDNGYSDYEFYIR